MAYQNWPPTPVCYLYFWYQISHLQINLSVLYFQEYFYDPWNSFDFVIVIGSFLDIAMSNLSVSMQLMLSLVVWNYYLLLKVFPPKYVQKLRFRKTEPGPALVFYGCSGLSDWSSCWARASRFETCSTPSSNHSSLCLTWVCSWRLSSLYTVLLECRWVVRVALWVPKHANFIVSPECLKYFISSTYFLTLRP